MAARGGGVRPTGTDGNDFSHREKVASQYTISAENKRYVKYSIYMHFFISNIVIIQLVFYFGGKFTQIEFPEVPKPNLWQYIWLASLIPALAGYLSLHRNTLSLLKFYYYGTLLLGFGTVLSTLVLNASDLLEYTKTKKSATLYYDFPVIVIWYAYLFVVIQIHALGIYFARVLIRAWSKDQKKRK